VRSTVDEQIDWLRRRRPAYLQLYPSVAAEIAARIGEQGAAFGIRKIFTFGETVSDDQRAIVRSALGANLIDTYSASEVGTIAVQCPASDTYHVMAEGNFLELLDEAGAPVEPGSPGRVVVTPIYNTAMPLVRYDIGDFAEAIEGPCPCGRTLPRLRRIMGRSRQMFRFADGSVRWPNVHTGDLTAIVPLREFQIVQHSATDIELRFERIAGHTEVVDLDALAGLARRDLHPSISIRVSELERIPRAPGGKFERYMSHVGAAAPVS
jgi:phenylacetate-CoA ligase